MKYLLPLILFVWLSGCQTNTTLDERDEYIIDTSYSAKNFNERVRYLVFHYTAETDEDSLRLLTEGETSAHYLVTTKPNYIKQKPVVLQLVSENQRAWHAGNSSWNGKHNLNDSSIGIEIVNLGYTETEQGKKFYPYPPEQVDLVARLARDIIDRYNIPPERVLGHSDIAPQRKSDPGVKFPWKALAAQGVGAWPDEETINKYLAGRSPESPVFAKSLQMALAQYGYQIPQHGELDQETQNVIIAFQMHFRPQNISGNPDAETEAIVLALLEKYKT